MAKPVNALLNHQKEGQLDHDGAREATGRSRAWCSSPTRSFSPSPRPMIPPAQTLIPASRTCASVASRSCRAITNASQMTFTLTLARAIITQRAGLTVCTTVESWVSISSST